MKAYVLIRKVGPDSDPNEGVPIRVFLDKREADLIMSIEADSHPHGDSPLEMVEVPVGLDFKVID